MEISELNEQLDKRFAELPPAIQEAISSADVEAHLRELSKQHQLHVDEWQKLENEVMLTLLGFQKAGDLAENLRREIGISQEAASSLAKDVASMVFAPIREEMERVLEHPQAKPAQISGVESVGADVLAQSTQAAAPVAAPAVTPSSSPQSDARVKREPAPAAYLATASHERTSIEGDPYREQVA